MAAPGIITIDGPAGAGKSTLGRRLAQTLGFLYLDSGALYRAVAWQGLRLGLDLNDTSSLEALLTGFRPEITADAAGFALRVDGKDVTTALRTPAVSQGASVVAVQPLVRRWVRERLRDLGKNGGIVADGRDLGTVVFPEARWKFYLDASLTVRARRRRQEWQQSGKPSALADITNELEARDYRDENRAEAPLQVPPDAVVIDSSNLSIEGVVAACLARIRP